MEFTPSFSVGLTQLENNPQTTNIVVGFVPANFDKDDPGFRENRSKHRNDPVMMKKLKKLLVPKIKRLLRHLQGGRNLKIHHALVYQRYFALFLVMYMLAEKIYYSVFNYSYTYI